MNSSHFSPSPREKRPFRSAVVISSGVALGLLAGIVFDAAAWLYAFGSTLNGRGSIDVPLIVTTFSSGRDVTARSGPGVLVLPIGLALVGALIGYLAGRRKKRA